MDTSNSDIKCVLCEAGYGVISDGNEECDEQSYSKLYTKGTRTINRLASDNGIRLVVKEREYVHTKCRIQFLKKPIIKTSECPAETRATSSSFNFDEDCYYCSEHVSEREKKNGQTCFVSTKIITSTVLKECDKRNDAWATEVRRRMNQVNDLRAADAIYHKQCDINFRTGRCVPEKKASSYRWATL